MCLGKVLALAKEENICLNQLVYSIAAAQQRLSALKDKTRAMSSERFFVYAVAIFFC